MLYKLKLAICITILTLAHWSGDLFFFDLGGFSSDVVLSSAYRYIHTFVNRQHMKYILHGKFIQQFLTQLGAQCVVVVVGSVWKVY